VRIMTTNTEMQDILRETLCDAGYEDTETFEELDIWTDSKGLAVVMPDGARFHLSIQKVA